MNIRRLVAIVLTVAAAAVNAGMPPPREDGFRWALIAHAGADGDQAITRVVESLVGSYGFSRERILQFRGSDASLGQLNKAMNEVYSRARPNDSLLVLLSLPVIRDGQASFLVPAGAQARDPSTLLNLMHVAGWLNASRPARIMLIYSGCPSREKAGMSGDSLLARTAGEKRDGSIDVLRACSVLSEGRPPVRDSEGARTEARPVFAEPLAAALEGNAGVNQGRLTGRALATAMQASGIFVESFRLPEYAPEGYSFVAIPRSELDYRLRYRTAKSMGERQEALSTLVAATRTDKGLEQKAIDVFKTIALDPKADLPAERPEINLTLRLRANESLAAMATPAAFEALAIVAANATDDSAVRRDALAHLSRQPATQSSAVQAVRLGLRDRDPAVREEAIRGIVLLKDHPTRDRLVAIAKSRQQPANVRVAALQALSALVPSRNRTDVMELLRDPDPTIRRETVAAVGASGPSSFTTARLLDRLASDDDAGVRRAAAATVSRTVTEQDHAATRDALIKALGRETDSVREAAARSLGQIGGATAHAALQQVIVAEESSSAVRIAASEALGEAASGMDEADRDAAVDTLKVVSVHQDSGLRKAAAVALGRIGTAKSNAIVLGMLEDKDPLVRRAARTATIAPSTEELTRNLKSTSHEARLQAVRQLGQKPAEEAAEPLLSALDDDSPLVRQAAIDGLVRYRDKKTIAAAVRLLDSSDPRLRAAAPIVLGLNCDAGGLGPLLSAYGSAKGAPRPEILRGLGLCEDPQAVEAILRASADQNDAVRRAAVTSMAFQATEPSIGRRLKHLSTNDPAEDVRLAAIEALNSPSSRWDVYEQEVAFDLTNDKHESLTPSVRTLSREFLAKPGYRIDSYLPIEASENKVKRKEIRIAEDGGKITFLAELEAGPVFDRWRGWFKGKGVLRQVPRESGPR